MNLFRKTLSAASAGTFFTAALCAQGFPANGSSQTWSFTGRAVDVPIPIASTPASIRVVVKGGDGGTARSANSRQCVGQGGQGARIEAYLPISGSGLAPGGTLRFIVGGKGGDGSDRESAGGGGGGGTGLLYSAPGSSLFAPVMIAGAGGGGFSSAAGIGYRSCLNTGAGQNATFGECGTSTPDVGNYRGGVGGCNGHGGSGGERGNFSTNTQRVPAGAGGGGFLSPGIAPGTGGGAGFPAGAAGSGTGGWGCGGGGTGANQSYQYGAGGGGGGYSGGGGGSRANVGGGGGCFVDTAYLNAPAYYDYETGGGSGDGYVIVEAFGAVAGDTCSSPFEIRDEGSMSFVRRVRGNTYDNTVSLPSSIDANCSYFSGPNARDEFYRFVNNTNCTRRIACQGDPLKENVWSDGWENGCRGPNRCVLLGYRNARINYDVPPGGTIVFRVSGFHNLKPNGIAFDNTLTITAISGPDADGDGIYDDFDNCPNTPNPNQADLDGDGVGDVCDIAIGDNSIDTDGDGKPDAIDPCPGPAVDCDRNGIDDSCDVVLPARLTTFDPSTANANTLFLNSYDAPAQTRMQEEDNALTLLDPDASATDRIRTTALFEQVSPKPTTAFSAEFWVKHSSTQNTPGGGFGFALLGRQGGWDTTSVTFSEAPQPFALKVYFYSQDVFGNPANHVAVSYSTGGVDVRTPLSIPVTSPNWRKVSIDFDGAALSVSVQDLGGQPVEVISALPLPNVSAERALYAVSADSLPGTSRVTTLIDQVSFRDNSGSFDRDINANQLLDSCEFGGQTSRPGNPANPDALQFGSKVGVMTGATYRPVISSASGFFPQGDQDFLLVGFMPANVPTPFGTQLSGPAVAYTGRRDQAFYIQIPEMGALIGLPVIFQGISFDLDSPSGFDAQFTNAIDATVSGWQPGGE